jgi:hypothetical protein
MQSLFAEVSGELSFTGCQLHKGGKLVSLYKIVNSGPLLQDLYVIKNYEENLVVNFFG